MRAAFAARLSPQRVLQLARSPSSRTAPLASRMGQAASMLPAGWWPAERGLAAAAAGSARGKAAAGKGGSRAASPMDQPAGEDEDLWLVCGLGNPGPRYESTRHNVGFMVVDELARREGIAVDRLQENAAVGRGRFAGKKILLVKPMTFMNVSGEAVGRLARFYRVPAQRVLVIYDDLDLDTAAVRLRAKGGHGGHNGMKSITSHLQGSKDFPRIRVGIGRPPGSMPVHAYVLQDFSKEEAQEVEFAVQEAIDIVRSVLTVGLDRAVSGIRVDAAGAVIKPPHSNGKQGNTQGQAKQPQAKKQRSGEPSGAAAGASVPAAAAAAGAAAHGVAQQLHAAPAVATAAPTEAH